MGMMMGMQAAMQGNEEESDVTPAIKSEDKHVSWTNVFFFLAPGEEKKTARDGHEHPNSRGVYIHYEDSLLASGWPSTL